MTVYSSKLFIQLDQNQKNERRYPNERELTTPFYDMKNYIEYKFIKNTNPTKVLTEVL